MESLSVAAQIMDFPRFPNRLTSPIFSSRDSLVTTAVGAACSVNWSVVIGPSAATNTRRVVQYSIPIATIPSPSQWEHSTAGHLQSTARKRASDTLSRRTRRVWATAGSPMFSLSFLGFDMLFIVNVHSHQRCQRLNRSLLNFSACARRGFFRFPTCCHDGGVGRGRI